MKSTKILALLLAVLMLLATALAGCSKDDGKSNKPGADVIEETEVDQSGVYDAKIHDLHGHEFYFLARSTTHQHLQVNEIYAEEQTGDKINDAVFKRNSQLEEKYNCKIIQDMNDDPATAVREQLLAGEYQYDFLYTRTSDLRRLSASNLLVDFKQLDNVDLSKAWWDQNAIEGLGIAGKAYYVMGSAGTMDERASWAIYFNKDYVDQAGLDSPYGLVKEGKWTIDKMVEYMNATAQDTNGDGVMEIGVDRFGYVGEPLNNWMHVAACNCRLSNISSSGDIELPGTVNKDVLAAWAALKPLLTSDLRNVTDNGGFSNGKCTFYGCLSGVIFNISKKEVNWGILP
ncbi:MAG: hypothetical protein J6Z79_07850, partial [Clostridia bacterium]|nr:hypothetical protein [Clostridia bacterium]